MNSTQAATQGQQDTDEFLDSLNRVCLDCYVLQNADLSDGEGKCCMCSGKLVKL